MISAVPHSLFTYTYLLNQWHYYMLFRFSRNIMQSWIIFISFLMVRFPGRSCMFFIKLCRYVTTSCVVTISLAVVAIFGLDRTLSFPKFSPSFYSLWIFKATLQLVVRWGAVLILCRTYIKPPKRLRTVISWWCLYPIHWPFWWRAFSSIFNGILPMT